MAKITLRIEADASGASATLANLKKEAQSISGQKIDLGIDAKTASAVAKAASALAALQRAQNQAAAAAQKTAQAEAKASAEMAKFGQQIEKTKQSQEKTAQSSNNLAIAQERTVQSANNLAAAQERTVQSTNNLAAAQERTAQSENNLASAEERTEQAHERTAQAALRLQTEQERTNRTMQEGTGAANALSVALGAIAARAFHMVVSKITQGIREAVNTMKDVDTQLTNISKVSGITGKALSDMGERAYETASKYGVAADEYLSAVYTFQKAGLGESAEAMGELAVKTMLVGDTTADVASQFLISANAAWKFGGNIEDLNRIVDEADYINNNYATDLTKLSQGLPRVASVAAQAGMSAEETLAAIGTITAVTQESGTKAATALRALILNIEGQIGTFVDDTGEEFKVTEESVKSMQGLMEKYAKAELDAARASGELINPMTAIRAIFEGMANSDLNDQELFQLLSGMGGKLRTNQLTALVQNYELFGDMLDKIAVSAGTADSEISLMMESWERKTQVLKNTWTEFISDVISTEFMKDTVEGLTAIVEAMDSIVERGNNPWYASGETNKEIESTEGKVKDLLLAISDLYLKDDEDSKLKLHDLQVELQIQQEILETKKAQYALEHAEEAKKLQKELTRGYLDSTGTYTSVDIEEVATLGRRLGEVSFEGNIAEYQKNLAAIISDFSDYYEKVKQVQEAGVELTSDQEQFVKNYELANNLAEQQGLHVGEMVDGYWQLVDSSGNVVAAVKDITQQQKDQQQSYQQQLEDLDAVERYTESILESNGEIPDSMSAYEESMARARGEAENLANNEENSVDITNTLVGLVQSLDFSQAVGGAEALARALEAASNAAAGISPGAGFRGATFASGTTGAPGGPALVNELGPELISDNGKAYIANGGRPAVVNLSRGAIVLPAHVTRDALNGGGLGGAINAYPGGTPYGDGLTIYGGSPTGRSGAAAEAQAARQRAIDEARRAAQPAPGGPAVPGPGPSGGKRRAGGGGGGGKSKKQRAEDAAKKLASQLSSIDKRASLADKEKRYGDEKNLYKRAISLIKKQLQRYKKAGFSDKSDEVVDLKSKLHDYEDKLANVNKTQWDAEIDAREQALREQRAQDQMAEKEAAVEKARQALENAQKQRNVRIFNAATGQWEWVADQGAVQRAQEQYDSAQRTLTQAQEDAELDALRKRRDSGETYKTPSLVGELGSTIEATDTSKSKKFLDGRGYVFGGAPADGSGGYTRNGVGGDSHDTVYNFGNITLSEAEAQSTSVAELARRLNVLKIS